MTRLLEGPRPFLALALLALALYLPGIASVPATDRDEARFVQATRQMVETGDYLHIRFQNQARDKKPAGIYWLQAAAVRLLAGGDTGALWAYRLVSVAGALAAVLALFALARPALGPPGAFLAALALAASVLLVIEAHIAKTDATLLATVVLAQGALLRLYTATRAGNRSCPALALLFWAANGAGILIKGPITPLVAGLTVITLLIADRGAGTNRGFMRALRPAWGVIVTVAIAAPWFIAVSLGGNDFVAGAVKGDLLPKLIGGQETHGAWPGTYLALALVTGWPAVLLAPFGLGWAWRNRARAVARFALAWAVPTWILFELVPTKLPHYVLPLYPALALMIGAALAERDGVTAALRTWRGRLWLGLWTLAGAALAALAPAMAGHFGGTVPTGAILATTAVGVATVAGAALAWRGRGTAALVLPSLLMVPFTAAVFVLTLPAIRPLWPAAEAATLVARVQGPHGPPVAAAGFGEPSLVYALGTRTMLTGAAGAAAYVAGHPHALALIAAPEKANFLASLRGDGRGAERLGAVSGFDIARGRPVHLTLYRAIPAGQ